MEQAIYRRIKLAKGLWRYDRVNIGRGKVSPADNQPPFYLRHLDPSGKRMWTRLTDEKSGEDIQTLAEAKAAIPSISANLLAKAKGITVAELRTAGDRKTLREAIDAFLAARRTNPQRTFAAYTRTLEHFAAFAKSRVRFVDGLTDQMIKDTLAAYKLVLEAEEFAPRTVKNHLLNVCSLLKAEGYAGTTKKVVMPVLDEKAVEAYTPEQMEKLFGYLHSQAINDETDSIKKSAAENLERYKFFLASSLREQEVQYLSWPDIDFARGLVKIRPKLDVGFTIKNHENRDVPLPSDMIEMLENRRKNALHSRWLFVSSSGHPEGHFLRKLKAIALAAGLNCGHCKTTIQKGEYENKRLVTVSCNDHPVCSEWTLHRFRKTRAIRWMENGLAIRKIQKWLGHASLETTEIYLGSGRFEESDRHKIDAA